MTHEEWLKTKEAPPKGYRWERVQALPGEFIEVLVLNEQRWRSIDTAPKDGTKIDVWSGGERVPDVSWQTPDLEWGSEQDPPDWCIQEWHHDELHWHEVRPVPTHWMPIPEGP